MYIIIFIAHQQKAADMKVNKEHLTPATANSLIHHHVLERNRIPLLHF